MRKKYFYLILFLFPGAFSVKPVYAHCPLCIVGAGAGLSLSRLLGIDDSITGVWMAALLGASSIWLAGLIKKKYLPLQTALIYIASFVLTVLSFYRFGLINEHNGLILNLPKLTFGIIVGGVIFYVVYVVNFLIKKTRGKVLFPYQSIVFSLGAMVLLSFAIYILINYFI